MGKNGLKRWEKGDLGSGEKEDLRPGEKGDLGGENRIEEVGKKED